MKIVIVGAGTVGFTLAEDLSAQRHHVSVIESRLELCQDIDSRLDVLTVNGSGASPSALESAGIKGADMLIAVTPSDQVNLLACNFAKQYGVPKRIARIASEEYTRPDSAIDLVDLGVTNVIEPEREVVKSILQYIELPGVTETANFQSDNVYLRGYRIVADMPIANKTLAEITQLAGPAPLLIVVIIREGRSVLPTGNQRLLPGDEIVAIMPRESFGTFKRLLNAEDAKLRKVIVSGESLTAVHLAEQLRDLVERVILVDPDETHARITAAALNNVEVLHGDSTNTEILQELHIETASFFIAAGKDTEDNVMACLLAKAEGAKEVVAINTSDRHTHLFRSLGLDHIINPRRITAQRIISSILRIPIRAHLGLEKVNMEVFRATAEKSSRIVGTPLRKLDGLFKKSIIIGAVMRGDQVIIPQGETVIEENDEVLVLSRQEDAKAVRRLFKPGLGLS